MDAAEADKNMATQPSGRDTKHITQFTTAGDETLGLFASPERNWGSWWPLITESSVHGDCVP